MVYGLHKASLKEGFLRVLHDFKGALYKALKGFLQGSVYVTRAPVGILSGFYEGPTRVLEEVSEGLYQGCTNEGFKVSVGMLGKVR